MIKLSEVIAKSLVGKSGIPGIEYVSNPYIGCPHKCVYCYADFMKRLANIREPWGDFVGAKFCDAKLGKKKFFGKTIFFSSVTDPYNVYEKRYRITEKILNQILNAGAGANILTKSDLVLRDIPIFKKLLENPWELDIFEDKNVEARVNVGFSFSTLDDALASVLEPRAPSPSKRLEALKKLHAEKIPTYSFCAPIFPFLSDPVKMAEELAPYVGEIWFDSLNMRSPSVTSRVMKFIKAKFPNLEKSYREIYFDGMSNYWEIEREKIEKFCRKKKIPCRIYF